MHLNLSSQGWAGSVTVTASLAAAEAEQEFGLLGRERWGCLEEAVRQCRWHPGTDSGCNLKVKSYKPMVLDRCAMRKEKNN